MKKQYFNCRDLVTLGVFAAASKIITLIIALAGGGPNPISILIKNMVFTTLLIILIYKIRKSGTLSLFCLVSAFISFLLLGGGFTSIPLSLLSAVLVEFIVLLCGGLKRSYAPILAVALYDFVSRIASLSMTYLFMREMPQMLFMVITIISFGYLGALIGLYTGFISAKELRHAGLINQ